MQSEIFHLFIVGIIYIKNTVFSSDSKEKTSDIL